jgi:hypothetical protein
MLRPGLDRERAVNGLVLTSWGTCDRLAAGCGLDPGAAAALLIGIAVLTLCAGTGAIL